MKNSVLISILVIFLLHINCTDSSESQKRTNIILIITDDQGYGDLGRHGNDIIQTPHLDKLHDESIRFTNFHVATTCAPTRSGLMSGMHCNRVGAWHTINGRSFLAQRFPTIASYLKAADYNTSIFGKWHLGDNYPFRPQDRGFDEVLVHGGGGVGQTPDYWNNDYYDDTYFHNGHPKKYEGFCTDIWFAEAMKYMKKQQETKDPFFCYISTNAPHHPHHVPQNYTDLYKNNKDIVQPNFYGQITNVDENIGKLINFLTENEMLDNTMLVFLTDNGTAAGASLNKEGHVVKGYNAGMRGKKVSEYEGGHRVPLFIKAPPSMNLNKAVYTELTTYTDLLPTILNLVDISPDNVQSFDGVSLAPLLKTGKQPELKKRKVIVDTQREDLTVKWKRSSVMYNEWRLVNNKELYNINTDPGQKDNVIDQYPDLSKELTESYENWWEDISPDMAIDNRIVIGSAQENPSLLTSHDWHSEISPPWHQKHIREGRVDNGHWKLQIEQSGKYNIKLHRWPPYLSNKISDELSKGSEIDGGEPFPIGVSIAPREGKIIIQDNVINSNDLENDKYYEFNVTLKKGLADLKTWIAYKDSKRGAYFVEIEKL